jgi:predicted ArsR family transcriptional regulator
VLYKSGMKKSRTVQNTQQPRDTKAAIMDVLKRMGPQRAEQLAHHFDVTAMAVRQHLYALQEKGLVDAVSVPKGRGRPVKNWALTKKAQALFPNSHQELAVDLLGHMHKQFGEDGLTEIINRHSAAQKKSYGRALQGHKTLEARLKALARLRSDEGYMAEILQDKEAWLLVENHCPICAAASQCTRLCANELEVFAHVLGPDVKISREAHILSGARRCAYRVSSTL